MDTTKDIYIWDKGLVLFGGVACHWWLANYQKLASIQFNGLHEGRKLAIYYWQAFSDIRQSAWWLARFDEIFCGGGVAVIVGKCYVSLALFDRH